MSKALSLSLSALLAVVASACTTASQEAAVPFAQVDANQDGVLSREEVSAGAPGSRFEALDTDGDGWVTSYEYNRYAYEGATGGSGD